MCRNRGPENLALLLYPEAKGLEGMISAMQCQGEENFMSLEHISFLEILQTGVSEIDDDHRQLIKDFNVAVDFFRLGGHRSEVFERLDQLLITLKGHFALEEHVLRQRFFPRLEAHIQAHRYFEADLKRLLDMARHVEANSSCQLLLEQMQVMLVEVLVRHDLDYKSHIMHTST